MRNILGIVLVAFCMLVQVAFASPEVFTLKNGHTVVIEQVPSSKLVTVDTWVKTGSINESDKNSGVAHFLEHLFFKGTEKRGLGEFERILDGKGAAYNAATSKDFTHYYITIKKDDLPLAMELQSDMLLHPAIPQQELDRERKVVLEEISRSNDSPSTIVFQNLNKMLYKNHPYKRRVLGSENVVQNISRDAIFDFYHSWYHPSNMITVIVGNVDKKQALNLVKANFVQKKAVRISEKRHVKDPELRVKTSKVQKGQYNTGYLAMGFKGVPSSEVQDAYALDLLATILGDGRSSRLYSSLKEDKNLVNSIGAGHYSLKEDSIFYISADFNPKNYAKIEKEISAQIKKIRTNGVSAKELERAKNILERGFVYGNESVSNVANMIGYNMVIGGNIGYYTNYIEEIKDVLPEDIIRVARKYLAPTKMAVSVLLPDDFEATVPVANKVCKKPIRKVSKQVLSNGMTFIAEQTNANDVVAMEILIKGGKFIENKPGVADVLASVLMKGTKNRTKKQLMQEIENYGIVLVPSLTSDYYQISLKATKEDFNRAYNILKDIMNNSLLAENEVQRAKSDMLENIVQAQDSPSAVAIDKFKEKIYQNAYGRSMNKVRKSVPNITRADIIGYYTNYFIPENMIVSVSGDICPTKIKQKLESFVVRRGKKVDMKAFVTPFEPLKKNIKTVTKKKTQTAWVVLGYRTEGIQNEKEYATLKVINSILGQGMSSRLFVNMREQKGLAYEVASGYPTANGNIYFVMYIGTNPDNVEIVQKEFKKELAAFCDSLVSEDELNRAKQRLVGYMALGQETNSQRAFTKARDELLGKGYNFLDKYETLIQSVSGGDIMNVAKKYFKKTSVISIVEPIE